MYSRWSLGRGIKDDTQDLCLGDQIEAGAIIQDRKCRRNRGLKLGGEQMMCLDFDVLRSSAGTNQKRSLTGS